jgi:uncharacterized membrane protein YgaE (UPF0421/DUF939 family)
MGWPAGLERPGLYLWEQVWLTRIGRLARARKRQREFTRQTAAGATRRRTRRSKMRIVRQMVTSVADQSRRRVTRRNIGARTEEEVGKRSEEWEWEWDPQPITRNP